VFEEADPIQMLADRKGGEPGQLATTVTSSRLLWDLHQMAVEHLQLGSTKAA
jgi:hypothetical protein